MHIAFLKFLHASRFTSPMACFSSHSRFVLAILKAVDTSPSSLVGEGVIRHRRRELVGVIRDQMNITPVNWYRRQLSQALEQERTAGLEEGQRTPFDEVIKKLKGATSLNRLVVMCEGSADISCLMNWSDKPVRSHGLCLAMLADGRGCGIKIQIFSCSALKRSSSLWTAMKGETYPDPVGRSTMKSRAGKAIGRARNRPPCFASLRNRELLSTTIRRVRARNGPFGLLSRARARLVHRTSVAGQ